MREHSMAAGRVRAPRATGGRKVMVLGVGEVARCWSVSANIVACLAERGEDSSGAVPGRGLCGGAGTPPLPTL